jgi:parvulin-like peptidyl-prolyl isomerase
MLAFFRRLTHSKVGVIITFLVLGVIALAFAAGDVTGLSSMTGGAGITGGDVAKVGKADVTANQLKTQAQTEMEGFRQQQPTLDMATFVNQGGFDGTLDRIISSMALEQFGRAQGMVVSKRAIDGQIASIPALQGPTGKFDENLYRQVLAQRKLTDAQIRSDIERDTFAQQLTLPSNGATQVASQLALPYASLLLEKRTGTIGFIPAALVPAGPAPSDADLNTFYQRNIARYTVPERRVVRYAMITPEAVKAQAVPTDAEIAKTYQQDSARYAATEKRDITQVVVADQAGAAAIAAKVKGGASLADAARGAGLEASTQTGVEKAAYAGTTSAQVADAVFAAASGAVIGPVRTPLGWTVAKVDKIEKVAARSLDQVRGEIAAALGIQKSAEALSAIHDKIDDSLSKNATRRRSVPGCRWRRPAARPGRHRWRFCRRRARPRRPFGPASAGTGSRRSAQGRDRRPCPPGGTSCRWRSARAHQQGHADPAVAGADQAADATRPHADRRPCAARRRSARCTARARADVQHGAEHRQDPGRARRQWLVRHQARQRPERQRGWQRRGDQGSARQHRPLGRSRICRAVRQGGPCGCRREDQPVRARARPCRPARPGRLGQLIA